MSTKIYDAWIMTDIPSLSVPYSNWIPQVEVLERLKSCSTCEGPCQNCAVTSNCVDKDFMFWRLKKSNLQDKIDKAIACLVCAAIADPHEIIETTLEILEK